VTDRIRKVPPPDPAEVPAGPPVPRTPTDADRRRRTDSTLAGSCAVLGAVTAHWWNTMPRRWWTSTPTLWVALGDLAALWGTVLLLALVLLAARPAWLERAVGHETMIGWHRRIAPWGVVLITVHVLAAIGVTAIGETTFPEAAWTLAVDYPDMLPACAGFVLLLVVAITSWHRIRDRLREETWWVVHLYSYLAIGLSLLHELSLGNSFTGRSLASRLWLGLHLGVLAVVAHSRLALPVLRSLRHDLRLRAALPDGPRGVRVAVTGRDLEGLRPGPGQFALVRFCRRDLWWYARSHPVTPVDGTLRITVSRKDPRAREILALRPGTRIVLEGPYGVGDPDAAGNEGSDVLGAWRSVPAVPGATGEWHAGDPQAVRWGEVRVRARVDGGRITDVRAVGMPDLESCSARLSARVALILREAVLRSQSTDVDMVSGATHTSRAYLRSLQSALDSASRAPHADPRPATWPDGSLRP